MGKFVLWLAFGAVASVTAFGQGAAARVHPEAAPETKQADIDAAVRVICPAAKITHGKNGEVSGCAVCPKGTDFYGEPKTSWEMRAETAGHFTSTKSKNLLLDGTGCDSHANNLGGTFIFAIGANKARLLRYENGLITDQCQKFLSADGRNGLVCRGGWMGQGEADLTVFATSFDATGRQSSKVLIHVSDTTGTCGQDQAQVVQQGGISEIQFVPKAQGAAGQIAGLTLKAFTGDVKCSVVQSTQKTRRAAPSVKSYTIEYTFDGRQFRLAPDSRAALAKFGRFSTP